MDIHDEVIMYSLAIQRDFIAQHYLIGGDWGVENELHSHQYKIEVELEGEVLNGHGYLVEIVHLESILDEVLARYREHTLNELEGFQGINPSLEHFCHLLWQALATRLNANGLDWMVIRLWENQSAWASYRQRL